MVQIILLVAFVLMVVLALWLGNKPRPEFPNKRISFREWQREQINHVKRLNKIAKKEGRYLEVSELPVYPKVNRWKNIGKMTVEELQRTAYKEINHDETERTAGGNHQRVWIKINGKWNWVRKPIYENHRKDNYKKPA